MERSIARHEDGDGEETKAVEAAAAEQQPASVRSARFYHVG